MVQPIHKKEDAKKLIASLESRVGKPVVTIQRGIEKQQENKLKDLFGA